jgi:hypothetical protein
MSKQAALLYGKYVLLFVTYISWETLSLTWACTTLLPMLS